VQDGVGQGVDGAVHRARFELILGRVVLVQV
jgi:O-acetyl-ADP-ribose deacetylase (regulator of RNase III)